MATEEEILNLMQLAYSSPKEAIGALNWRADRQREQIVRIPIVCDCYPADITGVSIVGMAWTEEPDERVTFQLLIDVEGRDYRIARIDWRPRQEHTNKFGPNELRGRTFLTSIHDYPENADLGLDHMQSFNLPVVKPIDPEPPNFNELLRYLRDTFHLRNALDIPVPPWSPRLL